MCWNKQLADNTYMAGEDYSIADIAILALVRVNFSNWAIYTMRA